MPGEADERDAELMRQAAAGDRLAFDEIVQRHAPAMFRFVRAIAPDDSAAEDALQDAFLGAWRGAARFRSETSVRNWLLTIARNAIYRQHRRRLREPEQTESLSELGAAAGWGDDNPETLALQRESHEALTLAMEQLTPSDREILLLRDVEGFSGAEVAAIVGLSVPAMKTRLHRARLRLSSKVRLINETTP